jgi:RecA-family ATPase
MTQNPEYDLPKDTEFQILCAYVREPERFKDIVEAQYFTSPLSLDIARVVSQNREKHPKDAISESTLVTLLKREFSGRKQSDKLSNCRRYTKKIFKHEFDNLDTIQDIARDWVEDRRYRQWLVESEKRVNSKDYASLPKLLAQTQAKLQPTQAETSGPMLPASYLHNFLAQEEADDTSDYLVFPIIRKQGSMLVFGLPKELKSWFGLELVVDVASGHKALGYFEVPRAAKALYVQVEDPASLTRERLRLVTRDKGLQSHSTLTNLRIVPRCPLNLADPVWVSLLQQEIQKHQPELIVFDVFRRLFRGNVADAKETATFFQILDQLRDTYGCATVLVHHARKTESSAMQAMALGSVNLTGWGDVLVYTLNKHQLGEASIADLQIETKSTLAEQALEIVVDLESEPVVRVRVKGGDEVGLVQKLITDKPGIEQKQLRETSHIDDKRLRKILNEGDERGLWHVEKGKGKGRHLAYYPEK